MKYAQLVAAVAEQSDVSQRDVRRVLKALSGVTLSALADGEEVPLRGICTIGSRWRAARPVRDLRTRRRIMLDGRFVVRFRTSQKVKDALSGRTPQLWRDPAHQAAWRAAETLIGDLDLYHGADAPTSLTSASSSDEVARVCMDAFGPMWVQVVQSYEQRVSEEIRSVRNYLTLAAAELWGDQPLVEEMDDGE